MAGTPVTMEAMGQLFDQKLAPVTKKVEEIGQKVDAHEERLCKVEAKLTINVHP